MASGGNDHEEDELTHEPTDHTQAKSKNEEKEKQNNNGLIFSGESDKHLHRKEYVCVFDKPMHIAKKTNQVRLTISLL